jgi:hypothetical protein
MKATLCIVSPEYRNIRTVSEESLEKYLPDWKHIEVSTDSKLVTDLKSKYPYTDLGQFICTIRPEIIQYYFRKYNDLDDILFIGSDVVFFDEPKLLNLMIKNDYYDAIVTPHLHRFTYPSTLSPNLISISKTGHINSDFVLWNRSSLDFLKWQAKIHETECVIKDGVFLDQTWLNYLPCFKNDIFWLNDDRYNAGYWRNLQNDFKFINNEPVINNQKVIAFQFSGFVKGNPSKISKHCNYPAATGDYLKFMQWYDKKI